MIQFLGAVNSKIVNGQLFTMRKDIFNQSLESTVFYKFRFLSFASKAIQRLCAKLHAMPAHLHLCTLSLCCRRLQNQVISGPCFVEDTVWLNFSTVGWLSV